MSALPLACSVRDCGLALTLDARTARCARGHAFDRAKSGYWNLLQPQDRRSLAAGDAKAAIDARARLLAQGVGQAVIQTLAERAAALAPGGAIVELGSGSGEALAAACASAGARGIGLDLSAAAAEHAARRHPTLTWVVANADRRLPLREASVALVLSVHGRRNPVEVARVLARQGHFLLALPAADDLVELRTAVQGAGLEVARGPKLLEELAPHFRLLQRGVVRTRHVLERAALLDLLAGTYRGQRRAEAERLGALDRLEVTLASEWFEFARA